MPYVTWEYYSSLFANVSKEQFDILERKAETHVNKVTHMRAKSFLDGFNEEEATDFQKQVAEQLKMTVCEVINALNTKETTDMGSGISSVSNDGYSESYKITTAAELETQLISIIRNGLSGTGLAGAL